MEIKTCEDYVIGRLLQLEESNEKLEEVLAQTLHENKRLEERIQGFMSYFEVLAPYIIKEDDRDVALNSHWWWHSDKNYETAVELYEFLQDNFSQDDPSEGEDDS